MDILNFFLIISGIFIIIEIMGIIYFTKKKEHFNKSEPPHLSTGITLTMIATVLTMALFFIVLIFRR
jgi:hypothetical protein